MECMGSSLDSRDDSDDLYGFVLGFVHGSVNLLILPDRTSPCQAYADRNPPAGLAARRGERFGRLVFGKLRRAGKHGYGR